MTLTAGRRGLRSLVRGQCLTLPELLARSYDDECPE